MTTLKLTVNTKKMPHTSEFFAVRAAVEHLYYALLFSTDSSYAGSAEAWRTWADQGFNAAVRQAPPETSDADELERTMNSVGKLIQLSLSSPNASLAKVGQVLKAVEAHRKSGTDAASAGDIQDQLFQPVSKALAASGADSWTSASVKEALEKGIAALTYKDITSAEISVS